jgi:hypothetical protein
MLDLALPLSRTVAVNCAWLVDCMGVVVCISCDCVTTCWVNSVHSIQTQRPSTRYPTSPGPDVVPDGAPATVPGFENWGLGSASGIQRMEGEGEVTMLWFGSFKPLMGSTEH